MYVITCIDVSIASFTYPERQFIYVCSREERLVAILPL